MGLLSRASRNFQLLKSVAARREACEKGSKRSKKSMISEEATPCLPVLTDEDEPETPWLAMAKVPECKRDPANFECGR